MSTDDGAHVNYQNMYILCQSCKKYYEFGTAIQDHLKQKPICNQIHDKASEKFFIKCEGTCRKKYFQIGNAIQSHLRQKPSCKDSYSKEDFEELINQCNIHRNEKRKKSKSKYFQKSKKLKTTKVRVFA